VTAHLPYKSRETVRPICLSLFPDWAIPVRGQRRERPSKWGRGGDHHSLACRSGMKKNPGKNSICPLVTSIWSDGVVVVVVVVVVVTVA